MFDNVDRKTILIVDDIQQNRHFFKSILQNEYNILEAENGVKALDVIEKNRDVFLILLDIVMPELDGFGVMERLCCDERFKWIPVVVITADSEEETQIKALEYGAVDVMTKPFSTKIALQRIRNIAVRTELNMLSDKNRRVEQEMRVLEIDEQTGIYNKYAFAKHARRIIDENPDKEYLIVRWDIDGYRVLKEIFGIDFADRFLHTVGKYYIKNARSIPGLALYCHWDADHFVSLREADSFDPDEMMTRIGSCLEDIKIKYKVTPRMGIYRITDRLIDIPIICDRTLVANRSIKSSYTEKYAWYDQSMSEALIEEQRIISEMDEAISTGQFEVYYQPQYNYDTNELIGAEALVRWHHPEWGLIPPGKFLLIFEENGYITKLDNYVCEQVCKCMAHWREKGYPEVPISINISRRDIYNESLCDNINAILNKYGIEPRMLHIEITETAVMKNPAKLIDAVSKLQSYGFHVHMDDFGSGYSSLNTLKDIPFDMLKLDVKFLGSNYYEDRSAGILGAIVHMAHSLKIPVIAEGVETKEQADFLKSISCLYMQGYFFAKPMPAGEYETLLRRSFEVEHKKDTLTERVTGSLNFMSSSIQSTLLFNSFVGGAAIAEYDRYRNSIELMRVNDRFLNEIGCSRSDMNKSFIGYFDSYDKKSHDAIIKAMTSAFETNDEAMCEINHVLSQDNPELNDTWLRIRVRYLARNVERYVYYLAVENITEFMKTLIHNTELSERLSAIISNVPGGVLNFTVKNCDHGDIKITYCNEVMPVMFGFTFDEYMTGFGSSPYSAVYHEDREELQKEITLVLSGEKEELGCRYRHVCSGGDCRWVRITGRIMRQDADMIHVSAVVIDITDMIEKEKNLLWQSERYRIMCTANGSMTFDYSPDIDYMNFTFSTSDRGFIERRLPNYLASFSEYEYIADEFQANYIKAFKYAISKKVESSLEYRADYFGEGMRWYRAVYVSVPDLNGDISHIVGRIDDIDNEMTTLERITSRLKTDSMTGMLNRESISVTIEQTLREKPDNRFDAILYIDLDNFSIVNDTIGHIGGDEILVKTADVIKEQCKDGDIVSRSGGDTFIIYMRSIIDLEHVQKRAETLMRAINRVFVNGVGPVLCSIAITEIRGDDESFENVFERLNKAMDTAKQSGKNRCIIL